MSIIYKIIFALLVFVIVGATTLFAMKDVEIPQETITKTIPAESVMNDK